MLPSSPCSRSALRMSWGRHPDLVQVERSGQGGRQARVRGDVEARLVHAGGLSDEHFHVPDPGDHDRGVPGPRSDPGRPGVQEPRELAEGLTRVKVGPPARRYPLRQRPERQGQRTHRDDDERHQRDRPVGGERRRQGEDSGTDDAADDEGGRGGQSQCRPRGGPRPARVVLDINAPSARDGGSVDLRSILLCGHDGGERPQVPGRTHWSRAGCPIGPPVGQGPAPRCVLGAPGRPVLVPGGGCSVSRSRTWSARPSASSRRSATVGLPTARSAPEVTRVDPYPDGGGYRG